MPIETVIQHNLFSEIIRALKKAEFEMSYAGWHKPEAICCRQDAYKEVRQALEKAGEA